MEFPVNSNVINDFEQNIPNPTDGQTSFKFNLGEPISKFQYFHLKWTVRRQEIFSVILQTYYSLSFLF